MAGGLPGVGEEIATASGEREAVEKGWLPAAVQWTGGGTPSSQGLLCQGGLLAAIELEPFCFGWLCKVAGPDV